MGARVNGSATAAEKKLARAEEQRQSNDAGGARRLCQRGCAIGSGICNCGALHPPQLEFNLPETNHPTGFRGCLSSRLKPRKHHNSAMIENKTSSITSMNSVTTTSIPLPGHVQ